MAAQRGHVAGEQAAAGARHGSTWPWPIGGEARTSRQAARPPCVDVLAKEGLERIVPEGEAFDPGSTTPWRTNRGGEGAPDPARVSEVLRAGYRWKGQVLRPAMVKVRG